MGNHTFCFFDNIMFCSQLNKYVNSDVLGMLIEAYGFRYCADSVIYEQLSGIRLDFNSLLHSYFKYADMVYKEEVVYDIEDVFHIALYVSHCMVWMDDYYLEHTIHYHKEHFLRPIVLSIEGSNIVLFDKKPIDNNAENIITKMLEQYGIRIVLSENNKNKIISDNDMVEHVLLGIKNTSEAFFCSDRNRGEKGLYYFRKAFNVMVDESEFYQIYYQINRAGGLEITRLSISNVLRFLKKNSGFKTSYTDKCIECFDSLSDEWHIIGNLFFKLSQIYDPELKQRISERIGNIIDKERYAFELLGKCCNI